jgi:hypothetical protein
VFAARRLLGTSTERRGCGVQHVRESMGDGARGQRGVAPSVEGVTASRVSRSSWVLRHSAAGEADASVILPAFGRACGSLDTKPSTRWTLPDAHDAAPVARGVPEGALGHTSRAATFALEGLLSHPRPAQERCALLAWLVAKGPWAMGEPAAPAREPRVHAGQLFREIKQHAQGCLHAARRGASGRGSCPRCACCFRSRGPDARCRAVGEGVDEPGRRRRVSCRPPGRGCARATPRPPRVCRRRLGRPWRHCRSPARRVSPRAGLSPCGRTAMSNRLRAARPRSCARRAWSWSPGICRRERPQLGSPRRMHSP